MMAYSGKFVLRMQSEDHQRLVNLALRAGSSLNQLCLDLIDRGLKGGQRLPAWHVWLTKQITKIKNKFGDDLIGIVVFGSRANATATDESDIDVLICLKPTVTITRALYAWWDDNFSHARFEFNPVFSLLPERGHVTSFWYEMALNHLILHDPQNQLQKTFSHLITKIKNGDVERKWSQGVAYWIMEPA